MPPVAPRLEVSEIEAILQSQFYARQRAGDLARNESLAANRGFVVEEDAVAREKPVGLAVIHGDPVRVELRDPVRRAGMEGGFLRLRRLAHQSVELGGRSLVKPGLVLETEDADRLEQAQRSQRVRV